MEWGNTIHSSRELAYSTQGVFKGDLYSPLACGTVFSFEAEKAGASRVLATDHFCWSGPGWGTREGFSFKRPISLRLQARDNTSVLWLHSDLP